MYRVGSYPGIVPRPGFRVKGEVYEIDSDTLRLLDDLEDEGLLYRRELLQVEMPDGEIDAWVYVWLGKVEEEGVVVSGCWREGREAGASC